MMMRKEKLDALNQWIDGKVVLEEYASSHDEEYKEHGGSRADPMDLK